jgi:hypothetical protein
MLTRGLLNHTGESPVASSFASPVVDLTWQGAAGRTPHSFLVLRIDSVSRDRGGLFGIRNSPSLADSFPDPTVIEASGPDGRRRLRGPGAELPSGLARGDRVAVGLIDAGHFLCLLVPPTSLPDDAVAAWAATQTCG